MRLTKTRVEGFEPPPSGYATVWDDNLHGFGLRVTANGARSYIVQARVNGRTRRVTIGRHGVLTAEEARKKARKVLGQMADGVDPVAEKRRKAARSVTLGELVDDYLKNRRRRDGKPLADSTKSDVRRHLRANFAEWRDKSVGEITHDMVRRKYSAIGKRSEAQANQAIRVLSALFNYAQASYRDEGGAPILPSNPVDVVRDSKIRFADKARETRIPMDRIGQFYSALEATRTDPGASISVRTKAAAAVVLMLTGLRKSDILNRTWQDVDTEAGTLYLSDTKHRDARTFPLPCQAATVIDAHRTISAGPYIFQSDGGPGPVHNLHEGMEPAREAIDQHVATHDLRRTFDDVFDAIGIDPIVGELLSNRKPAGSSVRFKHYMQTRDLTRYREQAERIADYFEQQRQVHEAQNVVTMDRGRSSAQ